MKHRTYYDRAMQSSDPRFAQIFDRLGYNRRDLRAEPQSSKPSAHDDDMAELRAEYQAVIGKRPFMGWDAETLQRKIDEQVAAEKDALEYIGDVMVEYDADFVSQEDI